MMNMDCRYKRETLTVPRGNDFKIHLCRNDIAPNNPHDIDFNDIVDLQAYATRTPDIRIPLSCEVDDDGDLLISVTAKVNKLTTYGVELVGKYNSHNWRWKCCEVFKISDTNCQSTVQGMESFDVETYYLWDTLDFEIKDDMLIITTDGHADIEDGVLMLQSTDTTELTIEGDTITATFN